MQLPFVVNLGKARSTLIKWWAQFPRELRLITKARLLVSIGTGGVLYLSPLVFNNIGLTATQIGCGVTTAAISGILSRIVTGIYLDKAINFSIPIKIAAILAIISDVLLIFSTDFVSYLIGQILLGLATGIYWPSVELAVPISSKNFSSRKGYALVKTFDALGVAIGVFIGSFSSFFINMRFIFIIDLVSMLAVLKIISNILFKDCITKYKINFKKDNISIKRNRIYKLFSELKIILILTIFVTSIISISQSSFPIDLAVGGINRPPLDTQKVGLILTIQMILLVIFQWPLGNWLRKKSFIFALNISIYNLMAGSFILIISNIISEGLLFVFIALIPISIGLAAFLPTASEVIIQSVNKNNRGVALSIYSQCFGISSLISPISTGILIDLTGTGLLIWVILFLISIFILPLVKYIKIA